MILKLVEKRREFGDALLQPVELVSTLALTRSLRIRQAACCVRSRGVLETLKPLGDRCVLSSQSLVLRTRAAPALVRSFRFADGGFEAHSILRLQVCSLLFQCSVAPACPCL
jgi:hypothetical protein